MTRPVAARLPAILPYLALAVGVLSLSLSAMFVRWAEAPGPVTGFYRVFFAAVLLTPFIIYRRHTNPPIQQPNLLFPVIAGVATALDFAFWNTAATYTTAANVTLIGHTAPLWVALAGLLFFRERLKGDFWLGLALAMTGAALIMGSDFLLHPHLGWGDLLALISSFFFATYYLATERGRRSFDAPTYAWLMALLAAGALFIINIVLGYPLWGYSAQTWLAFLGAAVVAQLLGYLSVTFALGHLPASIVSPTMIGQPVLTALLAIPLLGEVPTAFHLTGGLMALAGIYLVNQAHSRARKQTPDSGA